nr:lyase family protein [Calditrichia bacterium]
QVLFDLNRMATDLILFSLPDFGFFRLPEAYCTGSSIMPQKKNPDVLELLRSHYHTLVGLESGLKTRMANQISGYHRDIQLSKGPLIQGFQITLACLSIAEQVISALEVDPQRCREAMTEELFATQRVYELVARGIPFREAYRQVARDYSGS